MSALWSADELDAALGGAPSAPLRAAVTGVSIDSRTLAPGDLFFAIRGEVHDGHDHVARAFQAGAAAAVVERARASQFGALGPLFAVDDTLLGMERLGIAARGRAKARIAAVTGSVGKTSAKEMLRVVLAASGATHASAASYNNHWGVPLTLARLAADADFGILEIGMNHAGEIEPLARMVRPHAALVTTIALVHIEYLGSIAAIADAKAEIFAGMEAGGVAVLNRDAPAVRAAGATRPRPRSRGSELRRGRVERRPASRLRRDGARSARPRQRIRASARLRHRRARPPYGGKRARRIVDRRRARSEARAVGGGARRFLGAEGQGRTLRARRPRRLGHHHRRELQRESRLDARGARPLGRVETGTARAAHRGDRRHARAWARGRGDARRTRRRARAQRGRSPVRRRPADPQAFRRRATVSTRRMEPSARAS